LIGHLSVIDQSFIHKGVLKDFFVKVSYLTNQAYFGFSLTLISVVF